MKMTYTDITAKTPVELAGLLKEKKLLLFELQLKLKVMQLTNTNELKIVKKDIARINTAITEEQSKGQ
jgi:large subunit ribosomal protein L29